MTAGRNGEERTSAACRAKAFAHKETGMKKLGLAALAVLLAGCVQNTTSGVTTPAPNAPDAGGGTKGAGERLRIALVPKGTTHEFWQTVKAGAEAAGAEFNCEVLFNGPQKENDIAEQIDILKNYGTQGVDGIAVAATDKVSLSGPVKDLMDKKIPVVVVDSAIEPDPSYSFIATDNVEAAKLAAKEMGRLLNGKGKVAVVNFKKGSGTADERERGFVEGIKEFPGIEIVATEYTESDTGRAVEVTEAILTAHPDLNGIFASNEPNVTGSGQVLERKGLTAKVTLVGFDPSKANNELLEKGVVKALIAQDPFKMGYEGVKALAKIIRGEGLPDKRIDTGAQVITPENMKTDAMQKILYPLGKK
jgi:ribose transport system substrate-binding protein